jgi:hypothetical protein
MRKPYPSDGDESPDPNPVPITVCTPTWLGVTLNLMRQRVTPTGPFLDLLNRFPLEQLEDEQARVAEQIAQLNTAKQLLDLAISARKAANGAGRTTQAIGRPTETDTALPVAPIGVRPRLKQAILAVMADGSPDHEWSPTEIHAVLDSRGWAPETDSARSQISNRLRDLVKSGQLRKPAPGRYYLMRGD